MSTLKDKKATLLAKIARQKAKQKEQIYTIPTITLSSSDKQRNANKTFIPNIKLLAKKAKSEDQMREFIQELNSLSDDNFDIPPSGVYNNVIIQNGYKLFMDTYVKDAVQAADDPNVDRDEIQKNGKDEWFNLETFSKLLWVLKGYGAQKDAEWGRKQFSMEFAQNGHSEEVIRDMIAKYLEGNVLYGKFITSWKANRGNTEARAVIANEIVEGEAEKDVSLQNTRLAVTEEEQDHINDLKERLKGYEEAASQLENKILIRTEILSELSHGELVNLTTPIIGKKTKDELIKAILNVQYMPIERETYTEMFGDSWEDYGNTRKFLKGDERFGGSIPDFSRKEEYNEFMENLNTEREHQKTELEEMSFRDIVLDLTTNKTVPQLVKLLLYEEFYNNREKLRYKIYKLGVEIHNLSLGKYIPRQLNVRRLKYNERLYREAILVQIRRLELLTKTYDELTLHASAIGAMKGFKFKKRENETELQTKERSSGQLISRILYTEFPDSPIDRSIPKVTFSEMKSVLLTLNDEQIHVLAYANGVQHPDKAGKGRNIEIILRKEFPSKKIKSIKQRVVGRSVRNWSYHKRRSELEGMSSKDLRNIALTLGFDLQKGVTNDQLIKKILGHEEYLTKLIPKEDQEKEVIIKKIVQITGAPASRYRLWTLLELQTQLDTLREESQEYWVEMERGRLFNKLSQIIDINEPKYKKAQTWDLKKLRRTLQKAAGSNWESYTPLVEDYSFVRCMEKFDHYNWIEGKVTGVWLSTVNGVTPKNDYIFKDVSIEEDGHLWYQANKRFFSLQCNAYKKDRVQHGDVLLSYTQAGKPVKFIVGYTVIGYQHDKYKGRTHMVKTHDGRVVQRTFIIQDEILFRKENEFDRRSRQTEVDMIQDILNETVTERTADFAMKSLSNALLEIAPMKNDYGIIHIDSSGSKSVDYNTPYMQILISTLRDSPEQSNKELFTKVASLLVFINIPESKTFRKNIEHEYYLPDILATLSPAEKFPEAFQDPNASGKFLDELTANINNKIYKLVRGMAMMEYSAQDPSRRKRTNPSGADFIRSTKTRKRIDACSNKSRVNGVSEQEIVYYKEDDKIYCFTVDELYNQLLIQENLTNPETGKQFDISFVKRFDQLYNKRLSDDGLLTGYFQKKYGFDMEDLVKDKEKIDTIKSQQPIIAKNLWEIVGKDLGELEDQLSNEKPVDGDEIDEDRDEERRDVEVDEGVRVDREIDENDACVYCKTHLSDDSIKSVILHGDESRIIKFCSFKCFENKNDWNKFKAKRVRKAKKKIKIKLNNDRIKSQTNKELVEKKGKQVPKSPTPVKLSRIEIKSRKKQIKKQIKEGAAAFDKIAFPLMSKTELKEVANSKNIKIKGGLSKMDTAAFLYRTLHPKSHKGILKAKTAEKEMFKIETRRDKKRGNSKSVTSSLKKRKK